MKYTIIGDVHGKTDQYKKIVDNCESSICVGDFGFREEWCWLINHKNNQDKNGLWNHWIVMGNHDYIPFSHTYPSIKDHAFWPKENIFMVRGAESVDKHYRVEGQDWFSNEELNYQEQLKAFDKYCECKPKIVISHDCPQMVVGELFGIYDKSQTRSMLEMMFQEHQPELWIFGHHHKSKDRIINGTRFICLDELETFELVLDEK